MTERWLPVPGYEGHYEVSDLGRVRSLDRVLPRRGGHSRTFFSRGRVLKPFNTEPDDTGYHAVYFSLGGAKKRTHVHSIVMRVFVGPRPEGYEVCHCDGNPLNNAVANLRYGTRQENRDDMIAHGTRKATAIACSKPRLTPEQVLDIFNSWGEERCVIARRHGITIDHVGHIRAGRRWASITMSEAIREAAE